MLKKMLVVLGWVTILGVSPLFSEDLPVNGSFEDYVALEQTQVDALLKKGFTFEFDSKYWAKWWGINDATSPASISFVEGKDAPDGKRYLNVKTLGETSIYTQKSIAGNAVHKISFMAKGEVFKDKTPTLLVYAYLYLKKTGRWVGKNNLLGTFNLENSWKAFSVDLPAVGDELVVKIAFVCQGSCDLDNVKVEKVAGEVKSAETLK